MLTIAAALLMAGHLAATPAQAPVVATERGKIVGERLDDGSVAFRGVPFAAPPVGEARWKPPQAVQPWSGVRDATRSRPACPQNDYGWNADDARWTSEDCLYLEVRTPSLKPAKPLPVMVWIHGGNNTAGRGSGAITSTIPEHGVVLVSIQYRLGALGWMGHPALAAETRDGSSGNYGLMDQQAALRWVRANIARFGGDPGNVTIFGQSAGSQNVGLQLVSPLARGLFHKAIQQSGTTNFGVPSRSRAQNEAIGALFAQATGLPAQADAKTLRALPLATILAAQEKIDAPWLADDVFVWLQPTMDGRVLRESPEAAIAAARGAPVPLLIGSNAREEGLFGGRPNAVPTVRREFAPNAEAALAFYGLDGGAEPADDPRLGDVTMQIATDVIYRCPLVSVSDAAARAARPLWQYQFDYAPDPGAHVYHSSELRYVFSEPGKGAPADAPPMQAYWINFARTGDPNGVSLPHWPRYTTADRSYLLFSQNGVRVERDLRRPPCQWLVKP